MELLKPVVESSTVKPDVLAISKGVRLYDADKKTPYTDELLEVTPMCLLFTSSKHDAKLQLDLNLVVSLSEEKGGFMHHDKLVLHLTPGNKGESVASKIKLAFPDGNLKGVKSAISGALMEKAWEKLRLIPVNQGLNPSSGTSIVTRSGIVGIERHMFGKLEKSATNVSQAFKDLQNLINMAKEMVVLAKSWSNTTKEKLGCISEDETVALKSCLMSLGIDDPVVRKNYSESTEYYSQLATQTAQFLLPTISSQAGIMSVSDAYCRVNRARGFDLLSPDDFYQACQLLERLRLPLVLRTVGSTSILKLATFTDELHDATVLKLLDERKKVSPTEIAAVLKISVILSQEYLFSMENRGLRNVKEEPNEKALRCTL
nr:EOG090X09MN [Moina brachiata]